MTIQEKDIIQILCNWLDKNKYPIQIPNAFIYGWECDYWVTDYHGNDHREFEIKISRSDYLKDAAKEKHKMNSGANFFYYVCPPGVVKKDEITNGYGLIVINDGLLIIQKRGRRLHNNKFTDWKNIARKTHARWWTLWKEKYLHDEISLEEYRAGFMIELDKEENTIP